MRKSPYSCPIQHSPARSFSNTLFLSSEQQQQQQQQPVEGDPIIAPATEDIEMLQEQDDEFVDVDMFVTETFTPTQNDGYAVIETVETTGSSGKQLLHPMNVLFPEGSVTAILGPSGSGKSTLLSVLTDSLEPNVRGVAQGKKAAVPFGSSLRFSLLTRTFIL
jgi:ABC-type multidrug transport system fused ATPase/permease subunit